jgi:hypothetical protein
MHHPNWYLVQTTPPKLEAKYISVNKYGPAFGHSPSIAHPKLEKT